MRKVNESWLLLAGGLCALILISEPALASTVLDTATDKFRVAAEQFGTRVKQFGLQLLFLLGGIQLGLTFIQKLLGRLELDEIPGILGMFTLNIGFFAAINKFSEVWLPAIIHSFAKIGQVGSGLSELTASEVIGQGIDLQDVMVQSFMTASGNDGGALDAIKFLVPSLILTALCLMILLSFVVLAGQMVLIQIQGYFWVAFAPVLVGFGGTTFTRDIAVSSLKGGITIGVKLMCIYLIAGVAGELGPVMGEGMAAVTLSDWSPLFWPTMVALILAYLSFQLPKLAGDLLNGTASLSAGDAASTAAMVVAGVAAAGAGAGAMAGQAMGAAGSAALEATGIAKALGAGMESAHDMGLSGASAMGHAAGEVASHGLGLTSQTASNLSSGVGSAFAAGVEGTTGGKIASAIQASRGGSMEGLPVDYRPSTPPPPTPRGNGGGVGAQSASLQGDNVAAASVQAGAAGVMGDATGASIGGTEVVAGASGPSGATDSGGSGRQGPKLHERIRQAGDQVPNDGHVVGLNANITHQV